MKVKLVALSLFMALTIPQMVVNAQEDTAMLTARGNQLSREYLRPSISVLYFTDGSSEAQSVIPLLREEKNEQFDENELNLNDIFTIKDLTKTDEIKAFIDNKLSEWKVGNRIMSVWFPKFVSEQEGYSIEMLTKRGQYAATDNDVLRNNASHRKTTLNELGEQLIDRSYVLVYYLYNNSKKGSVDANAFVYKLDFNPEVRTDFYENFFSQRDGIQKANFPLKYLTYVTGSSLGSTSLLKTLVKKSQPEELSALTSNESDLEIAASALYSSVNVKLGKKVADFKIKKPIFSTSPLRAKMGTKEGLKIDDRFDVMEMVENNKGEIVAKRKGVVRVKKVADNSGLATGETSEEQMSTFYNYVGMGFDEGMTLVKNPELGIGIAAVANTNYVGVMADYRLKFIPELFAYVKVETPLGKALLLDEDKQGSYGIYQLKEGKNAIYFTRYSIGLMKEFHFARYLFAAAGAGYGYIHAVSNSAETGKLAIHAGEGFARFGFQVLPSLQIFGQASYSAYFGRDKEVFSSKYVSPMGFGVGVKYAF